MAAAPKHPPMSQPAQRRPGEPYCSNCGYSLVGATETAVCPECGRPLVEVLTREPQSFAAKSKHYKSDARLFGLPVVHIAMGPNPETGEIRGKAKGIIAIGDVAAGGLALGGMSFGIVSFGGMSIGIFSAGGMSIGMLAAAGGGAVGLGLSAGGGAVGALASGGGAAGYVASGGGAVGYYARGGGAWGQHVITPAHADIDALSVFNSLSWYFGPPGMQGMPLQPIGVSLAVTVFAALLVAVVALMAHRTHTRRRDEQGLRGSGT